MGIGCAISSVAGGEQQYWMRRFKCCWRWSAVRDTGCAISSVAGAVLYHWMRRFICLLMENSAGANSNFTTPFACAAYSVGAGPYRARVLHLFASWIPVSNDRSGFF
jgi:hypothetical protein